ncbi:MAG: PD-(D/E)XK nuclease family protein [Spirochaetia bacterium]|nr:PD-(D/E)XK nuclease family protein [Spirochaetia bacterium]
MEIDNSSLSGLFIKLLDPEKSTIALCRNVADIMRLRIFFHEKLSERKRSILNVQFLTIDQWIRKTLPVVTGSENLFLPGLTEKIFLHQAIETVLHEKKEGFLREVLDMPGFRNDIPHLWRIFLWSRNSRKTTIPKTDNKLFNEVMEMFERTSGLIKNQSLINLPEFLTSSIAPQIAISTRIHQVISLFPSNYDAIETTKLFFLQNFHDCKWRFVTYQGNGAESDNTFPSDRPLADYQEVFYVAKKIAKINFEKWTKENLFFFRKSETPDLKIWMASTLHDEAHLAALSVKTLFDRGTSLHNIFILYSSARNILQLELAFRRFGFQLNHPEKTRAETMPVIALAIDFVDILALKQKPAPISRNKFIDFLFNPALAFPEIQDNQQDSLPYAFAEYLSDEFSITDFLSLESIIHKIKGSKMFKEVEILLTSLLETTPILSGLKLPSTHSSLFLETMRKSLKRNPEMAFFLEEQWKLLEKLLDVFASQDKYFPSGLESDLFYTLLHDELYSIKIKSKNYTKEPMPEIFARHVQEALQSPVDYLFVLGLDSKSFPVSQKQHEYLGIENLGNVLYQSPENQKKKLSDSFLLVNQGICLTFNLENDPAPSDFIFEQIPAGRSDIRKQAMIKMFPVYNRRTETEIISGLAPCPEEIYRLDSKKNLPLINSFNSKFFSGFSGYQKYTGLSEPVNREKVSSSSSMETIAVCPQRFYFSKVCKIKNVENYDQVKYLERRDSGNLFHYSARNFINQITTNYPALIYSDMNNKIGIRNIDNLLQKSFDDAMESNPAFLKSEISIFSEVFFNNCFHELKDFFRNFFYACQIKKYPLAGYYPVAAEHGFHNICFENFRFTGAIDRIDYSPTANTLCIVDYKTGTISDFKKFENENLSVKQFQLPVYMLAAIQFLKHNELNFLKKPALIEAAWQFLKIKDADSISFLHRQGEIFRVPPEKVEEIIKADSLQDLTSISEILNSGYFFASGHKKKPESEESAWDVPCSYCEYQKICDRTPFETMKKRISLDRSETATMGNIQNR